MKSIFEEDRWYPICLEAQVHKDLDLWVEKKNTNGKVINLAFYDQKTKEWYRSTPDRVFSKNAWIDGPNGDLINKKEITHFRIPRTRMPGSPKIVRSC